MVGSPVGERSKVREHDNVVCLLLVARRKSGFAVLTDPRTVVRGAGDVVNPDSSSHVSALGVSLLGPNTSLLSFTRLHSPYHRPLVSVPQAHVHPQEKKSMLLITSESGSMLVANLVYVWCRFNTAATSVTIHTLRSLL